MCHFWREQDFWEVTQSRQERPNGDRSGLTQIGIILKNEEVIKQGAS